MLLQTTMQYSVLRDINKIYNSHLPKTRQNTYILGMPSDRCANDNGQEFDFDKWFKCLRFLFEDAFVAESFDVEAKLKDADGLVESREKDTVTCVVL